MKYNKTAIIISLLLFLGLITATSCNRQNKAENQNTSTKISNNALGIAVAEIVGGVMVVFQDKQDNYWFGGNDKGLYKYDGKTLLLFTTKDGLYSSDILGIQEDSFGNIYLDGPTAVCKFDGQKFTSLTIAERAKNEWKLDPRDLWFRMGWDHSGPYRYDGKLLYPLELPKSSIADEFYAINPNASFNPYGIYSMYKDRKGHLWFGTSSLGVCRYDGKTLSWLYEKQLTETPSGGSFGIRSIIEDKAGAFWFCNTQYRYNILPTQHTSKGTNWIDYEREAGIGTSSNAKASFPYFMSIVEADNGDLWMATYEMGVWRNNGKELIHYPIKLEGKNVLLFSIYKDRQGGIWLGTHQAGVYQYNGTDFEQFKI